MTQNEFFNILMDGLKDIPEKKLQDIIFYYENKFTLGLANGKTENEIITELGDPHLIVNKFRNEDVAAPAVSNQIPNDNEAADTFTSTANISSNYNTTNTSTKNSNPYTQTFSKNKNRNPNHKSNTLKKCNVNTILKICIAILSVIIFFPVIGGIIGFIFGIFGMAIGLFAASIGVLIGGAFTSLVNVPNLPSFVTNFPYPVLVLFSLGSISLSILLLLSFYYLCKLFLRIIIKIYNSFNTKGDEV